MLGMTIDDSTRLSSFGKNSRLSSSSLGSHKSAGNRKTLKELSTLRNIRYSSPVNDKGSFTHFTAHGFKRVEDDEISEDGKVRNIEDQDNFGKNWTKKKSKG